MALVDVREYFVVQDRLTGAFVDENMTFCTSLRFAARVENRQTIFESMCCAIEDGLIECPEGYEVHSIFEPRT